MMVHMLVRPNMQSRLGTFVSELLQESEIEQQLSRVEDAVLMLQGCPYLLAPRGPLLLSCRQRAAPQARVSCTPL